MKKIILIILGLSAVTLLLLVIAGIYKFIYPDSQPEYDGGGNAVDQTEQSYGPQNAPDTIESNSTTPVDGVAIGEMIQDFENEVDPTTMSLAMKPWTWVKTIYNNNSEVEPKQKEAFTLTFTKDNSVSISTDCNQMGGNYETSNNQITFGPLFSTKMYCEGSQEQEFAKMLMETESYSFTGKGELIFELKPNSDLMIFE